MVNYKNMEIIKKLADIHLQIRMAKKHLKALNEDMKNIVEDLAEAEDDNTKDIESFADPEVKNDSDELTIQEDYVCPECETVFVSEIVPEKCPQCGSEFEEEEPNEKEQSETPEEEGETEEKKPEELEIEPESKKEEKPKKKRGRPKKENTHKEV